MLSGSKPVTKTDYGLRILGEHRNKILGPVGWGIVGCPTNVANVFLYVINGNKFSLRMVSFYNKMIRIRCITLQN